MSGSHTKSTGELSNTDTVVAIDDTFIGRFDGVLEQDQLRVLEEYKGTELKTGVPPEEVCGRFACLLNERIRINPAYGLIECDSTVIAEKEGDSEEEEEITLIDLAVERTAEDIEKCATNIRVNRPSRFRQATLVDRIAGTVLRLRPDLLQERQQRESAELKAHKLEEGQKSAKRSRSFNILTGILEGLVNDQGLELANRIPQATLLEAIERLETENDDSARAKMPAVTTPSREERIRAYEPREDELELGEEVADEEPAREEPKLKEIIKHPTERVQIEASWLDPAEPVELEATRYSGEAEVDLISALTTPMKSVASKIDRNPLNEEGLDKYQAIIDHLARAIASGCMPWQLRSFVKPLRRRGENDYPDNIWYTFDRSPNSPRVYFTFRTPEDKDGTEQANQLLIISETDKAHQLEVLQRLTGLSRKTLRKGNAGSK
jgi:hypothetical protein